MKYPAPHEEAVGKAAVAALIARHCYTEKEAIAALKNYLSVREKVTRQAREERISDLRAQGIVDPEKCARLMQDVWPGATTEQVRGLMGKLGVITRAQKRQEPWRPGEPR